MAIKKKKTFHWSGPNKRRTRVRKLTTLARERKSGFLPSNPAVFSFAGAQAHFERGLVARRLAKAEDIVTVQTTNKSRSVDGCKVLRSLIRVRDESLPGMVIWPHHFNSFSLGYTAKRVFLPAHAVKGGSKPAWLRSPTFHKEMKQFLVKKPRPFSVLDVDMCGIFSEGNGHDIIRLMKNGVFADRGLLFVNHQKGRDNPGGKVFPFIKNYFSNCRFFDIDTVLDDEGDAVNLDYIDATSWWILRYRLVPMFYVLEAFKAGYQLEVERLVEYRDKGTNAGVNMLQWFFRFRKLRSTRLQASNSLTTYARAVNAERKVLDGTLETLRTESYTYNSMLD